VTRIVAVRHGESTWNRDRRMQGWAPTRLTDRGREQAAACGAHLADEYDVDRIHASDLRRVRETVAEIEAHVDAPVSYEAAWRERDLGVYQGLTYDDVFGRFPEFALGDDAAEAAARTPESGESLREMADRVATRFEEVLDNAGPDETRLVVAHGGPIRALMVHVDGASVREAVLERAQDNCGVTQFVHDPGADETWVECENVTTWGG